MTPSPVLALIRRTSLGRLADQVGDLLGDALRLGTGQVDLVHAGDQLEPGVDREVGVGDRLRLDALAGVDHQQRALAGGERARHLVGEVDVTGGVDQVQLVGLTVEPRGVEDPHRRALIVIPRSRSSSIESSSWRASSAGRRCA